MVESEQHRILLVDDEANITKSLYRLLRKEGWYIDTCDSGPAALKVLSEATKPFSLIISDQRMPEMSGAEFLEKAAELAPGAVRFLLTGYSDLQAVENAVNKGKIQRYLTKPWNDEALLVHVRQAIEEVELRRENERLTLLTQKQNRQLYELGLSLEKKVRERTSALKKKNEEMEILNRKLDRSFMTTIHMLLSLIEATNKVMGGYLRQVGRFSKRVALQLGFREGDVEKIEIAGLLHDIGLFGLPESFLHQSENDLYGVDLQRYRQHPAYAAVTLEMVDKLAEISTLVLHHHERYDGKGFPDGLKGEAIPMGSRIIGAVSDYCRTLYYWPKNFQEIVKKAKDTHSVRIDAGGVSDVDMLLQITAEKIVSDGVHKKYDSNVVAALIEISRRFLSREPDERSSLIPIESLRSGMMIPQDLFLYDGRMLLSRSTILDAGSIKAIQKLGKLKMLPDSIVVTQ